MKSSPLRRWLRDRRLNSLHRKRAGLQRRIDLIDGQIDQVDSNDTDLTVEAVNNAMAAAMKFPWKKRP